ncbi:hypothetical protein ACFPZL_04375 [Leucobacter soli]|uniref:Uncharacterized protein n=1 Tax=Leucobacter soli TaxID=2812850 RepID=A0A916JXS1_9MICO|nr:hypothetical protein [Leucobacter soli]CAG7613955.1 hypothetical protein LEUCIP111803_01742 [Leucobacter soli]
MSTPILYAVSLAAELEYDSPGAIPPVAFLVTAIFAVAVFLLGFDLVRRIRRNRFRAEIQEGLSAELAERNGVGTEPGDSGPQADGPTKA